MRYTIKDLREGKCAVINDGTREEIREVLKLAFPEDNWVVNSSIRYYHASSMWVRSDYTKLPAQSVKDFLTEDTFVLPKNWCIKVTEENKDVIHHWKLDNTNYSCFTSASHYVTSKGTWDDKVGEGDTEITFEQFKKYLLNQKETNMDNRFPFTASGSDIKKVYDSISASCSWSKKIFNLYGKNMLDSTDCVVEEELYKNARKDANTIQHLLLDNIFGKDVIASPYKEGELGFWTVVNGNYDIPMGY